MNDHGNAQTRPPPVTGSSLNGDDPALSQPIDPAPPSYSARESSDPHPAHQTIPPREPPRSHARYPSPTTHSRSNNDLEACLSYDAPPDYQHTSSPPAYKHARDTSYDFNPRSSNVNQLVAYDPTAQPATASNGLPSFKYRWYGSEDDRRRRSCWAVPTRRWGITAISLIACILIIVVSVQVSYG